MQPFGTIAPLMVKAPNLVQMRQISHGSIIESGVFWKFMFLAEFQHANFAHRLLFTDSKPAKNIFPTLFICETDPTDEKSSRS